MAVATAKRKTEPTVTGIRLALMSDRSDGSTGEWELASRVSADVLPNGDVVLYVRGDMGTVGTVTIPEDGLSG